MPSHSCYPFIFTPFSWCLDPSESLSIDAKILYMTRNQYIWKAFRNWHCISHSFTTSYLDSYSHKKRIHHFAYRTPESTGWKDPTIRHVSFTITEACSESNVWYLTSPSAIWETQQIDSQLSLLATSVI